MCEVLQAAATYLKELLIAHRRILTGSGNLFAMSINGAQDKSAALKARLYYWVARLAARFGEPADRLTNIAVKLASEFGTNQLNLFFPVISHTGPSDPGTGIALGSAALRSDGRPRSG